MTNALWVMGLALAMIGAAPKPDAEARQPSARVLALAKTCEADALFGKRTDVKDSHDRYANRAGAALPEQLLQRDELVLFGTIDPPGDREAAARLRDAVLAAEPIADPDSPPPLPWPRLCWSPRIRS